MKTIISCFFFVLFTQCFGQNLSPKPMPFCIQFAPVNANIYSGLENNAPCYIIGGNTTSYSTIFVPSTYLDLKAYKDVTIKPNSSIIPTGNSYVNIGIQPAEMYPVWYQPNGTPGEVGKYRTMELGFKMPDNITIQINDYLAGLAGLNPFDYDEIDLRIELTSPTGQVQTKYGFYYQPFTQDIIYDKHDQDTTSFPWRFRFAPDETGIWKCKVGVLINNSAPQFVTKFQFTCTQSSHKGRLKVSNQSHKYLEYSGSEDPFLAMGNNVASGGSLGYTPAQNNRQLQGIQDLIDVDANFVRLELGGQSGLPDWPIHDNYSTKLDEMYAFDRVVQKCEENGIYFSLFRHHVEVRDYNLLKESKKEHLAWGVTPWDGIGWYTNPYRVAFGLNQEEYSRYFTDPDINQAQKKSLRYIFARWGYNSNMAIYGYSEADIWMNEYVNNDESTWITTMGGWMDDQKNTVQITWGYPVLFAASYGEMPDNNYEGQYNHPSQLFNVSDVLLTHQYSNKKNGNYKDRFNNIESLHAEWKKPILIDEMGIHIDKIQIYNCTGIDYHNNLWATSMMGGFGSGLEWWWDRGVHDNGYQADIKNLQLFFDGEELISNDYSSNRWDDKLLNSGKKSEIYNFYMVSDNKEKCLGWVQCASYYWYNLKSINPCLYELITTGNHSVSYPTAVDPNWNPLYSNISNNYPPGINFPYVFPPNPPYHDNGYNPTDPNSHILFHGPFPVEAPEQLVSFSSNSVSNNPKFEIHGLKKSIWPFNKWYKIEFYSTRGFPQPNPNNSYTQTLNTNVYGTLKPHIPNTNSIMPDYAYKLTYLGDSPSESSSEFIEPSKDTTAHLNNKFTVREENLVVQIFPNPNTGEFIIKSNQIIKSFRVLDMYGKPIYLELHPQNSLEKITLPNVSSGIYNVEILFKNDTVINRKIMIAK